MIHQINIYNIQRGLDGIRDAIKKLSNNKRVWTARSKYVADGIKHTKKCFAHLDLGDVEHNYTYLAKIEALQRANRTIAKEFEVLLHVIEHGLKTQAVFVIDSFSIGIARQCKLSKSAKARFPKVAFHHKRAAWCYMLGEHTASMFHCMRAGGELLPYLGEYLSQSVNIEIGLHEPWKAVIDHLRSKMKELDTISKRKYPENVKRLETISSILDRMETLKTAWRDRVMHKLDDVDQGDARDSILSMRALVESLTQAMPQIDSAS